MKTLFFLSLTLAACRLYSQDYPLTRHLSPDADAIYHFNLAALTGKVCWSHLTAPIPAPQHNTDNHELAALLRDPDHAGVDMSHELYVVTKDNATSLLIHLTD